jgi:hypothetical protein
LSTTIKTLAVLWTLLFAYLGVGAISASSDAGNTVRTVDEIMRADPKLTRQQAEQSRSMERAGRAAGGACCLTFGLPVLVVVWGAGLGGLAVLLLLFRKREPITANVSIEQRMPRTRGREGQ